MRPLLALLASATVAAAPVVQTSEGAVRGVALEGNAAAFHGIPFAAPPVGPLRWREAQPAKAWPGVRDASSYGAMCIQPEEARTKGLPQSEDCLTVNVVTPDRTASKLPVLVSIYGGAFYVGSNRFLADQDLSPIVKRGVVLVSPNYRVGRMGFFAHPALTAEAKRGTGNFWLSDQIAALEWTKRNVAKFGGDPNNVTILGCSAGGSSINSLMAAPQARGLFANASTHSGGGFFNATRPLDRAEHEGEAFAGRAGAKTLAELRALTPAQVLAADPGPPNFGAIIDGHFLPEQISAIFAAGKQAHVPFIVGSTSNEASIFGLMGFDAKVLRDRFGVDIEALRPAYEAAGKLSDAELLRRVQTDFIFTSAAFGMASLAARAAPTWSYHFDHVPAGDPAPGAPHCADMRYLFGPVPGGAAEQRIARKMQDHLYNFIAHGDPNGAGLPAWARVTPGSIRPLVIRNEIAVVPDFRRAEIEPWFEKWRTDENQPKTLP